MMMLDARQDDCCFTLLVIFMCFDNFPEKGALSTNNQLDETRRGMLDCLLLFDKNYRFESQVLRHSIHAKPKVLKFTNYHELRVQTSKAITGTSPKNTPQCFGAKLISDGHWQSYNSCNSCQSYHAAEAIGQSSRITFLVAFD